MNRRKFLELGIPISGAILLAPGIVTQAAMREVNRQFIGGPKFDTYDILINGGGLRGYFAALHAAQQGKRVLLVEKRSSLGYEWSAKGRRWLGVEGIENLTEDLRSLLMPAGEASEVHATQGTGPGSAVFDSELTFMAGSVKKGLLRNALINHVDVLLMTDVCGIFTAQDRVHGVLLACKHGLFSVRCKHLVDVTEHALFSRSLLGQQPVPSQASFVLEIWKAASPSNKVLSVPGRLGLVNDQVIIHRGKHADHQVFLEYTFPADGLDMETVEHRARQLAVTIGKELPALDPMFADAQIMQFAWETSVTLTGKPLPAPRFRGHIVPEPSAPPLTCAALLRCQQDAAALVEGLPETTLAARPEQLYIIGATLPVAQLKFSALDEPGFTVPLQRCTIVADHLTSNRISCQVFVAGGGTAGSMAAIGAVEKGAQTIVADTFYDLGGTKTMCGVMGYYHGYRDHPYFKQQDDAANQLALEAHMNKRLGRVSYLLQQVLQGDGRFLGGAMLCGAVPDGNRVTGGILCRNGKLELVQAEISIDATGDGDLAAFAGADFDHGDQRTGKTQNYSQWDIGGAGKMPSHTNRDYDIIDNTRIAEVQRGLFISHYEAHFYDFYPMLAVRESRRIHGEYTLDLIDAVEATHFEDVITFASSDFDPHYVGLSDYTRCGFLLPHSNDIVTEIPYRSIVPKGLDGLLLSGRGFSQTQEAYQFTRMTADLIVLGYLTGQIAAALSFSGSAVKDFDIGPLQQEWETREFYPEGWRSKPAGRKQDRPDEAQRRVAALAEGRREYLYECIKLPSAHALPLLQEAFKVTHDAPARLLIAKALAWFNQPVGSELILQELNEMFKEESQQGYPEDFVDNYDMIRGRELNVLENLYWRINQNIALLARARYDEARPIIRTMLEQTTSGGPMMKRESSYFDERIDLKLVPFFNRILNLCYFVERLPDAQFVTGFEKLLTDPHIGGYVTTAYEKVRWRVYGGDLELFIAAALARCGSQRGYQLLTHYLTDLHYRFKAFAAKELLAVTGSDYGTDHAAWERYLQNLRFPRPVVPLNA